MKFFAPFFILVCLIPFLTACPSDNTENLPESPDKFVIHWREDGGMMPIYEDIYITKDSAYWHWWHFNAETKISWKPNPKDIDTLYQLLLENNFDKIESYKEGEVYDRGGESISITVDDESYDLNNSGSSFIRENDRKNFNTISGNIEKYAFKNVQKQMISVSITVSDKLKAGDYYVVLNINENIVFDPGKIHNKENELPLENKTIKLYPSDNHFKANLYYKDSTNRYGGNLQYKWADYIEKIDSNTTKIEFDVMDNDVPLIKIVN